MKKYKFPSYASKDSEEKHLASLMQSYIIEQDNNLYDINFVKMLKENFGFQYVYEKRLVMQEAINLFVTEHGYLPSDKTSNFEEKKLGKAYRHFVDSNSRSFDKEFSEKHKHSLTWNQYKINITAKQVINFFHKKGIPPSGTSKDKIEKRLGIFIYTVRATNSPLLDEKLKKIILSMKTIHEVKQNNRGLSLGVFKQNNKFRALISTKGKNISLGSFNTCQEASAAVEKARNQK